VLHRNLLFGLEFESTVELELLGGKNPPCTSPSVR
jgi:hypothetical protein